MAGWTNDAVIRWWGAMPRAVLEQMEHDGDFAKRHLVNPVLLRMLGDVHDRRVLDAGCGNGYFSRMLAERGADVIGVEPGQALFDFAVEKETERRQGVRYVRADLCDLPDLGGPFDAVVASMVLPAIPDWASAMRACVKALASGGLFLFTVNHPCFEQLWPSWLEHGEYRTRKYLAEYEISGPHGVDFHRPLSTYLNELISTGCRVREIAEPGLDPVVAVTGAEGIDAYVHLPNFLIVAADRA
jgi:SAM-dependent methyltransferase